MATNKIIDQSYAATVHCMDPSNMAERVIALKYVHSSSGCLLA